MSTLALFDPDCLCASDSAPKIIPLRATVFRTKLADQSRILQRARLRFDNRICPCCCRSTVSPMELRDAEFDRNGREIPGTATIVAFNCERCGHEWPASRPAAV